MSTGPLEPLRLTSHDLFTPQVEAYLDEQRVLRRDVPQVAPRPLLVRIVLSSYFYLSLASGLGAFIAWAVLEPFLDDQALHGGGGPVWPFYLLFPTVAAFVGLFLGAAEGIMCRNPQRAVISASVGLGIGLGGGLIALFAAGILFSLMVSMAVAFMTNPQPGQRPTGFALLILMMGRAAAWAVAAIPAGLGQGIALREKKVMLNGLLGGVLGGLLGGLLFDPIDYALTPPNGEAAVSRAVGLTIIGLMVGLFVGVVEQWTKTAWLLMKAGPLAGKQFIIYRDPTVLGSSPKADIYLFKDEAIEPHHALIHNRGGRYEIEDQATADGTYVNGIPVTKRILKAGDQIVLGKTVLEFSLREV
jgi:hypothetical protein